MKLNGVEWSRVESLVKETGFWEESFSFTMGPQHDKSHAVMALERS